jgi:putative inorganic carbon (HCO3(-)) transporter
MLPGSQSPDAAHVTSWQGQWLAWPGLLAFVTFCWLPLSYFRMVGWPWILIWQFAWLVLLGWGLWQLRQFQHPFRALGYGLDAWLAAIAGVLLLSSLLADFPRVALWNLSLAIPYGLGLYIISNWLGHGWLTRQRLWLGLVAIATITAMVSLVLWQPDAAMWSGQDFASALRNHQPLGHHNFVGGYFGLLLPLSVAGMVSTQNKVRAIATVATLLMAIALYASGSRGALLGCVVWLLVVWVSKLLRVSGTARWRWTGLGLAGVIAIITIMVTNPRLRDWLSTGFSSLAADGQFQVTDGPTLDRWFMLRLGGNMLRDHPLLGVGPGVMSRVSNLYRPIEAGAGLDHIQQLHNTPLQLAGELGLAGLALYFIGLFLVGRLWWQLWQQPLTPADRALLGGIGGSFLAYGVSSLTDYQLENIAIAGTLLLLMALLINLAQAYLFPPSAIPQKIRRILSLSLWGWIGITIYVWMPFALTVAFNEVAHSAMANQQLAGADSAWHKATRLSPWDPTAAAIASQTLFELYDMMGESELREDMRSLLLEYTQQAQQVAPNDVWFNQNLAVLYQDQAPGKAIPFAMRAVDLLPRNHNGGYFLLGQLLLAQGQPAQAITAFTIEALITPASLTYPLWQQAPLKEIYPAVVTATLANYDQLLAQLSPQTHGTAILYETRVLLGWWTGNPLPEVDTSRLRPIVQVLLLAETDQQQALQAIQAAQASGQDTAALRLFAAWLDPHRYWLAYVEHADALDPPEQLLIQNSLVQRQLRPWLQTIVASPSNNSRAAVGFAYRNRRANDISLMLKPLTLRHYSLINDLGLFQPWPREFVPLDQWITALQTKALSLSPE